MAGRLAALIEYGEAAPPVRSIMAPSIFRAVPSSPRPPHDSESARVKIQEADAKSLLVAQGLPVPAWTVAHTRTGGGHDGAASDDDDRADALP